MLAFSVISELEFYVSILIGGDGMDCLAVAVPLVGSDLVSKHTLLLQGVELLLGDENAWAVVLYVRSLGVLRGSLSVSAYVSVCVCACCAHSHEGLTFTYGRCSSISML